MSPARASSDPCSRRLNTIDATQPAPAVVKTIPMDLHRQAHGRLTESPRQGLPRVSRPHPVHRGHIVIEPRPPQGCVQSRFQSGPMELFFHSGPPNESEAIAKGSPFDVKRVRCFRIPTEPSDDRCRESQKSRDRSFVRHGEVKQRARWINQRAPGDC